MFAVPAFNIASLGGSIVGAIAVMFWRVRETRTPVTARKIIIPPLGMATGFCMFIVPAFRVPWTWALIAFLAGAIALAYPLLVTTKLVRNGDSVMMQRSHAFLAVIILLAGIRLAARGYLDHVLSIEKTAALFFVLAFGMIVRWRAQMYRQYRALVGSNAAAA